MSFRWNVEAVRAGVRLENLKNGARVGATTAGLWQVKINWTPPPSCLPVTNGVYSEQGHEAVHRARRAGRAGRPLSRGATAVQPLAEAVAALALHYHLVAALSDNALLHAAQRRLAVQTLAAAHGWQPLAHLAVALAAALAASGAAKGPQHKADGARHRTRMVPNNAVDPPRALRPMAVPLLSRRLHGALAAHDQPHAKAAAAERGPTD